MEVKSKVFTVMDVLEKLHPKAKDAYYGLFNAFPEDAPVFIPMVVSALAINSVLSKSIREGDESNSHMCALKKELEFFLGAAYVTLGGELEGE
jgi:hypothetical protein